MVGGATKVKIHAMAPLRWKSGISNAVTMAIIIIAINIAIIISTVYEIKMTM